MCGRLPRTPSPVLPRQIPRDSGGVPRVVGCRAVTGGIRARRYPVQPKEFVMPHFTIPGLSARQGSEVAHLLQKQLSTYNDLHLTLKHVHWNVVGPVSSACTR